MKAYVLEGINNLVYKEIGKPVLKSGEVLVKVKAAGICGSDIPRIFTTGAHVHPIVPGHEFSGEVVETGSDSMKKWVGKRVGIFPLIPCMECECCKSKQYEMCRNYSYLGSRCDGGFAEYVSVPEWNLISLPEGVSYREAAMLEPLSVAAHAVRRAVKTSDKKAYVAVWGLGTIGLASIVMLKALGFENIIGIGKKKLQKEKALELGVSEANYVDSGNENVVEKVKKITGGRGVDVALECVGRSEVANGCVEIAAPYKTVMLVGNPASDICFAKETYWKILRNQLTVFGTWNSSFTHDKEDDWNFVLSVLAKNDVKAEKLISHVFPFDKLENGLFVMKDKSEDYIKIMTEL